MNNQEERTNAFNEVRAILGKLDRSIDEARSRRLEPDHPSGSDSAGLTSTNNNPTIDREIGNQNATGPKTELQKKSATFGRAKPLNGSARPVQSQWKSTGDKGDELIG